MKVSSIHATFPTKIYVYRGVKGSFSCSLTVQGNILDLFLRLKNDMVHPGQTDNDL